MKNAKAKKSLFLVRAAAILLSLWILAPETEESRVLAQSFRGPEGQTGIVETTERTGTAGITETAGILEMEGAYRPMEWEIQVDTVSGQEEEIASLKDQPTIWNPLEQDAYLPPVRNQSPYGACWAFSSLGMGEIEAGRQGHVLDLSELHLAYFSYHTVVDPLGGLEGDQNQVKGDHFLGAGGNLFFSRILLANWTGAAEESVAPYEDGQRVIQNGLDENLAYEDVLHLQGALMIDQKTNRNLVKQQIRSKGSVGAAYGSYTDAAYYQNEHTAYYCEDDRAANHAILIVGWDDAFPAGYFAKQPPGDGAWLIRNSWGGSGYGKQGYFWLSYYDNTLEDTVYSFTFEDAGNYDHNYQYDGAMMTKLAVLRSGDRAANVFVPEVSNGKGEVLCSVGFYCGTADTDYKIEIYTGLEDRSDPESGVYEAAAAVTGTTTAEGYYTVPLAEEIPLEKGQPFSVVVTLEAEDGISFIMSEASAAGSWYQVTASAKEGQSFLREDGAWRDYGKTENTNLRIKAFTRDTEEILVTRVVVDPGELILDLDQQVQLQTMLYPAQAAADQVFWSSADETIAWVDREGRVRGLDFGETVIRAETEGRSGTCRVCIPFPLKDIKISKGNWKYEGIRYVYLHQIMGAVTGTDLFYPDRTLTRGMFAVILHRMAGLPEAEGKYSFQDVASGKWYSDGIRWAAAQGIAEGYSDGNFGVDDPVTREQAAKMICRFASLTGKAMEADAFETEFIDEKKVNAWAVPYMKAVTGAGIISGKPDGTGKYMLDPRGLTTRAECAAMIQRLAQWLES